MQKFFVVIALVFISSIAVAAQTTVEQKPLSSGQQVEFAKRTEAERSVKSAGALVLNGKTESSSKLSRAVSQVDGRVIRFGPTTTYLKNGLSTDEVIRLLGKPSSVSKRQEGNRLLSTYTFPRSHGRVFVAEFENGVLVQSRTEAAALFEESGSER